MASEEPLGGSCLRQVNWWDSEVILTPQGLCLFTSYIKYFESADQNLPLADTSSVLRGHPFGTLSNCEILRDVIFFLNAAGSFQTDKITNRSRQSCDTGGEVGFPMVSVSDAPGWVEGFLSEELSISSRELVAGSVFTDYRIILIGRDL